MNSTEYPGYNYIRNFRGIGWYRDTVEKALFRYGIKEVGTHRLAVKRADVLLGDSFAAAARRNDR